MMWFLFGVVAILCFLCYLYQTQHHGHWKKRGVPMVAPHWFFGNLKDAMTGARHIGLTFQEMYSSFPDALYVGYMKIRSPALMLRDPELVKAVLSKDFSSFGDNEMTVDPNVDPLFGFNPFVLKGEEWRRSRSHVTPTHTSTKLKTYFPGMMRVCDVMIGYVKDRCDAKGETQLEAKDLVGKYTTDVVATSVFGVDNNTFENDTSVFYTMTNNIFESTVLNNLKVMLTFLVPKESTLLRIRFTSKETEEQLLRLTRQIIQHRQETGEKRNDFFQQMITLRENDKCGVVTDEYIASHCFGFMADGYETSSDVICFTLFELAWHQEVQDKLRDEILDMVSKTDGHLNAEDIANLKYLNMVVSESLRLHPPAMTLSRSCTVDVYKLPAATAGGEGVEVLRGTTVVVPVYALHMDPKHFPDPQTFDPERFSDEAVAAMNKFVYLPFGEGPRICLGSRFGLLQVKTAVVGLLRHFKLKPSARSNYPLGIDPKVLIMRPLGGAWITFQQVQN